MNENKKNCRLRVSQQSENNYLFHHSVADKAINTEIGCFPWKSYCVKRLKKKIIITDVVYR